MKICIQTGNLFDRFGIERACGMIAEAGFEGVDLNLDKSISPADIRGGNYKGNCVFEKSPQEAADAWEPVWRALKKEGLEVCQAHSIYPSYVPGRPEVLEWTSRMHAAAVEYAEYTGCRFLVVHGIGVSPRDSSITQEKADELNMRLYGSLTGALKGKKLTVCHENLFTGSGPYFQGACADPHRAAAYIDELNRQAGREAFGLCVDTGHLNLLGIDFRTYAPVAGKRIRALHINDNLGNGDSHRIPFAGSFNWRSFLELLKETGYSGDLSFETFAQTDAACACDERLVLPTLRLIAETGRIFREILNG